MIRARSCKHGPLEAVDRSVRYQEFVINVRYIVLVAMIFCILKNVIKLLVFAYRDAIKAWKRKKELTTNPESVTQQPASNEKKVKLLGKRTIRESSITQKENIEDYKSSEEERKAERQFPIEEFK